MTKTYLNLITFLVIIALILLLASVYGSFIRTQAFGAETSQDNICRRVVCAENTSEGVETNCRSTVVKCSSASCNSGPCINSPAPIQNLPSPSPFLTDVPTSATPSLTPLTPASSPIPDINTSNETALWQEAGRLTGNIFRLITSAVIAFLNNL